MNYKDIKDKFLIKGENLTEDEVSVLLAIIDSKEERLTLAKKWAERIEYIAVQHHDVVDKVADGYIRKKCGDLVELLEEGLETY